MGAKEKSNGQNAIEKANKETFSSKGLFEHPSEELFHKEPYDNTPFYIIQEPKEKKWFITWGHHRLTAMLDTKEECEKLIETRNWHLIGIYIGSVIEEYKEFLKGQ